MENTLIDNSRLTYEAVEATLATVSVKFIHKKEEYSACAIQDQFGVIYCDLHIKRTRDGLDMSNDDDLKEIAIHYIGNVEYGEILEENWIK